MLCFQGVTCLDEQRVVVLRVGSRGLWVSAALAPYSPFILYALPSDWLHYHDYAKYLIHIALLYSFCVLTHKWYAAIKVNQKAFYGRTIVKTFILLAACLVAYIMVAITYGGI